MKISNSFRMPYCLLLLYILLNYPGYLEANEHKLKDQIQDLFYKNSLESYIPEYSLDTPYKYNSAGGLIYKIRFVSYGQKVNTCIANLRSFLFKTASEIVDKVEGIKVKDVHSHGKAIIFDYCTRNFRGFDLPNWRTQEEWFLGIRPYSPTPRNVSPAGSR